MLISGTRLEYTEEDATALDYYLESKEKWGLRVWEANKADEANEIWSEKKKNRRAGIIKELGSKLIGTQDEILKQIKELPRYATRTSRDNTTEISPVAELS